MLIHAVITQVSDILVTELADHPKVYIWNGEGNKLIQFIFSYVITYKGNFKVLLD